MTHGAAVGVAACAAYDGQRVAAALEEALSPLGGMSAFVSAGQRVFVKVNLLMKAIPDRAVTTHPELVRAVVRAAFACGAAEVLVGDSPAGRATSASTTEALEAAGIAGVCAQEGARLSLLAESVVRVKAEGGRLYQSFNLGRDAVEADVLINLPKLKTHTFMMYTGAVKNLFGTVPGLEKAQFHINVPDRDDFADMLVDLLLACAPELTVMDAVVGMEGQGPSGGSPRPIGALLASADAVALDMIASAIAGFEPMDVYTNRAAARRGMAPASLDDIRVEGPDWRGFVVRDFAQPVRDVTRSLPPSLARRLRRHTVSSPELQRPEDCNSCGTCGRDCPVSAIDLAGGRPSFDYDACIRCYCCQELCPQKAIGLRTPWLVRAVLGRETGHGA
ncbi:MAG TPA: DUF362 domain-containing protein [Coriobacteriia bacterium]